MLHELTGAGKDFGYEQQHREQKNDLRSVGFNVAWQVSDDFNVGFRLPQFARTQPAGRFDHRRWRDGVQPRGQGAEHLPGVCSQHQHTESDGYGLRQFDQLLDADVPVQQRSADCAAARCSRIRLRPTPARVATQTTDVRPTSLGSQVLRIGYQDQRPTSSSPAWTANSASRMARRSGSASKTRCDGIASARFGRLSSPWVTGVSAMRAPCRTWSH